MAGPERLRAWMEWEYRNLNRGLVPRKRTLAALLLEDDPACETRAGERHSFDRAVLKRMADVTSPAERKRLRLPITVTFSADYGDEAYVADGIASEVLRRLEGFGRAYPFREGKMFLPHSLALSLVVKYKGALQQLFL
jgi:uncharacterized protein (UPF0216 family)